MSTPTNAPRSTSAPVVVTTTYGTIPPNVSWCGVHHPHGPHLFVGRSGLYAQCPGSNCSCEGTP